MEWEETGVRSDRDYLDRLAETAVVAGLNLARDQELIITAPVAALRFVRKVTEVAYRQGASVVTALLADEQLSCIRFKSASNASFDKAPLWLAEGLYQGFRSGAARLAIVGDDPTTLQSFDPARVNRLNNANTHAFASSLSLLANFRTNWSMVPCATPRWARAVFPGIPDQFALTKLEQALVEATRARDPDLTATWRRHSACLRQRASWLNEKRLEALSFRSSCTNLRVPLARGHRWLGGSAVAENGIEFIPNIPTEEVYTMPDARGVTGYVVSTRPLSYRGTTIEGMRLEFDEGRVVSVMAERGQAILEGLLNLDFGAGRLGEVALVPASSPISKTGILFFNTLLDENACSHLAFGQSLPACIEIGGSASADATAERGGNTSSVHVDWMIGSNDMDVDGLHGNGTVEPIMRRGEWADLISPD